MRQRAGRCKGPRGAMDGTEHSTLIGDEMAIKRKPKSGSTNTTQRAFFTSPHMLVQFWGAAQEVKGEQAGEQLEEFVTDITTNLVEWTVADRLVLYKTKRWWYVAEKDAGVVHLTRIDRHSLQPSTTIWANTNSLTPIGKQWLRAKKEQRVALVPGEQE